MSYRCERPGFTDILILYPGVSDDGYRCTASIHDLGIDDCQRLLCSFGTPPRQGSNVRACKDDRFTWTVVLLHQDNGDSSDCCESRSRQCIY